MTRLHRTILFSLFVIVFVILVPAILLYSQGYRIDWQEKRLTLVGGLFLKTSEGRAKIFINNKFYNETDVFFKRAFIPNLLPKDYNIKIQKEGYHIWEKKLEIKPEMVTEARNVLLVLENPKKELMITEEKIRDFVFAPDKRKLAYLTQKNNINILDVKAKKIIFPEGELQEEIGSDSLEIISWSPNSKRVLLKEKIKEVDQFKILDLDKNILESLYLPAKAKEFYWHPSQEQILLLKHTNSQSKKDEILWYDYGNKKFSSSLAEDVACLNLSQDRITFIQKSSGLIFEINLEGNSKKQILPISLPETKDVDFCRVQRYGNEIIILADGILYIVDHENKTFKKLGENIKNAQFSSLGKSLAYSSNNEIWVYYLQNILLQPFKYKGDEELITRFGEKIDEVIWYPEDNEHLIFRTNNKIKIIELDDRDQRNVIDFVNLINSEEEIANTIMAYNQPDKYLYFIENNNLYRAKIK